MSLEKFMDLPYTIMLKKDEDGDFFARIKELKGCSAHGSTAEEALNELESMKKLWLQSCIEEGKEIPLPDEESELPSGKWLQRAPRWLHGALVQLANEDGVSLNQLVISVLSKEIGLREGKREARIAFMEQHRAFQTLGLD